MASSAAAPDAAAAAAAAAADVDAVDRVLLRLSLTAEEDLGGVLAKLLPRLLAMLTPASPPALRGKLLETLSHINKRVRDRPSIALPFGDLLGMLPTAAPFTATFVLVYARLAFDRLPPAGQAAALPQLLRLSGFPDHARDAVLAFALRALRHVRPIPADATARAAVFPFTSSDATAAADAALFCEYALDTMLFVRPPAPPPAATAVNPALSLGPGQPVTLTSMARAAAAALQPAAAAAAAAAAPEPYSPPPGLSLRAAARVVGADKPTRDAVAAALAAGALPQDELTQRKRDILRLLVAGVLPEPQALLIALAGSVTGGHHEVVEGCEDAVKRLVVSGGSAAAAAAATTAALAGGVSQGNALGSGASTPTAAAVPVTTDGASSAAAAAAAAAPATPPPAAYGGLLEDPAIVNRLFTLVLGTVPPQQAQAQAPPPLDPDVRLPLSPPMKVAVLAYLTRSRTAATAFPALLRVVFECWFGAGNAGTAHQLKLQGLGLQLAVMAFQLSPPSALQPLAPLFLQGLLRLLNTHQPEQQQTDGGGGEGNDDDAGAQATAQQQQPGSVNPLAAGLNALALLDAARIGAQARAARLEASRAAVLAARDYGERQRLREVAYSAVGALAAKAPAAFSGSLAVPRLLFARLASEDVNMRLAVSEALSSLAQVYATAGSAGASASPVLSLPPSFGQDAHDMLSEYVGHGEYRLRQAVAHWAAAVFPFSDVRARYTLLRLVGDPRAEVRAVARKGLSLRLGKAPASAAAETSSQRGPAEGDKQPATSGDDADGADADGASDDAEELTAAAKRYPPFGEMLSFLMVNPPRVPVAAAAGGGGGGGGGGGSGAEGAPSPTEGSASKRSRHDGSSSSAGAGASPAAAPATALPPVGPRVALLPALPLAALLEFLGTCLDASTIAAGVPAPAFIRAMDAVGAGAASTVAGAADVSMAGASVPPSSALLHNTGFADGVPALVAYRAVIEYGLAYDVTAPDGTRLHEMAAACLARLAAVAPAQLCADYARRIDWLLTWLRHSNRGIRRSFSVVLGAACTALPLSGADGGADAAASVTRVVTRLVDTVGDATARGVDGKHGALLGLGQVLERSLPRMTSTVAAAATAAPSGGTGNGGGSLLATATAAIIGQLPHRLELIREAATTALATVARLGPLPLPGGEGDAAAARASMGPTVVPVAFSLPAPMGAAPTAATDAAAAAGSGGSGVSRSEIVLQLYRLATGQLAAAAAPGGAVEAAASPPSPTKKPAASKVSFAAGTSAADVDGGGDEDGLAAGAGSTAATEAAAVCLGAIASGELRAAAAAVAAASDDDESAPLLSVPPVAHLALSALLALSVNRYEQVQFTVGQALVEAASARAAALGAAAAGAGTGSGGGDARTGGGSGGGIIGSAEGADLDVFADSASDNDAAAGARAARAGMSPPEVRLREAVADALLTAAMARPLQSGKAQERGAAGIWLLTLVHALGRVSPALGARLPQLQSAFSRLLGEKSQFAQEAAAKGLALVYECADGGLRGQLVAALLQGFDTGRKVATAALPTAADAAGGAGGDAAPPPVTSGPASLALSAGGDAAYRELCAMANEAGNPELIYQFLSLSSHHAVWHARGGAAHGLQALLSSRARRALEPHVGRLVPRLFRYQYDPNARVRASMTDLWRAVVRDPKAAVSAHIGPILAELTAASVADHWREREAACLALSDVLQGRSAADVRPHLEALWRAALRAIDDIKDSVREAGLGALKALGKLTLRLCDPAQSGPAEGADVVRVVLPFLLRDGITSPIKDAQAQCVGYLRDVVKVAGPLLRPHVPELVGTALSLLSSFEKSELSYLQMHVDAGTGMFGHGLSGEALEAARIAATRSGPLGDVIDRAMLALRDMTPAEIAACVPAAPAAAASAPAASGAGAGAGDAMDVDGGGGDGTPAAASKATPPATLLPALVDRLKSLVRSGVGLPSRGATARFICALVTVCGDLLTPLAAGLTKTLLAALDDPSPTLRREFAAAAAHVARVAKPATLTRIVARAGELAANGDDAGARATAGFLVLQLAKHAGEAAKSHAPELVPLAFLGWHDPDADARGAWGDAWEALSASTEQQLRLYASEIVTAIGAALDHSGWVVKRQGGDALVMMLRTLTKASEFRSVVGGGSSGGSTGSVPLPVVPAVDFKPGPAGLPAVVAASAASAGGSSTSAAAATAEYVGRCLTQHAALLRPAACPELLPHAGALVPKLLASVPGRVWEGKEALVTALAELTARTAAAFVAPASLAAAVAGGGDASASAPAATAAGGKLSAEAVLRCLLSQAARSNVPPPFATAAANGVAAVCRAFPGLDAYAAVAQALTPVLARLGRPVQLGGAADAAAGATAATHVPAAAAAPRAAAATVVGARVDEDKEGEARAAAKERDAELAAHACACLAALAAALPAVVLLGAATSSPSPEALATLRGAAAPFAPAAGGGGDVDALATGLASVFAVHPTAGATQAAGAGALLAALGGRLAEAGSHTERAAIASAVGCALAKTPPAAATAGVAAAVHAVAACAVAEDRYSTVRVAALSALLVAAQRAAAAGVAVAIEGDATGTALSSSAAAPVLPLPRATAGAVGAALRKHRDGPDAAAAEVARAVEALRVFPAV